MAEKKTTAKKTTTTNSGKKQQKSLFQPLFDYLNANIKRDWRKERVKCCKCGNEWNCIFYNIKGGEYKLQCPKCGARNSMVVNKD